MKFKITHYWISTGLFAIWMLINAYACLTIEEAERISTHFGFPDYFRIEWAIAKMLGTIILLLPIVKGRLKEWAYAGIIITVISGFIGHLSSGDGLTSSSSALVALAIVLTSCFSFHGLKNIKL